MKGEKANANKGDTKKGLFDFGKYLTE